MANIVPSELHPDEAVSFRLANADAFEVPYETTDREVIRNAQAHPWLKVELDAEEAPVATYRPESISPEEDALSAENDESFDPAAVERDRPNFEDYDRTAIDAGEDQGEVVETAGVAETFAADEAQDDTDDEGDKSF